MTRAARAWLLLVASCAWPSPALADTRARVAIVDARAPDAANAPRDRLIERIAGSRALEPIGDAALVAALAGAADPAPRALADAMLDDAARAYLELRLVDARRAAEQAALAYLSIAEPGDVAAPLGRALAIVVVCADQQGDRAAARGAANRLRALGATDSPPEPIPAATWARYPEIDAGANVLLTPVKIETDPPGASVLVDLRPAGTTPIEVALPPGAHWITVAAPGRARATTIVDVIERHEQTAHVALAPAPPDPWASVRRRVADWRAGSTPPDDGDLASLRAEAGVDVVIALYPGGDARVIGPAGPAGRAPVSDPTTIVAIAGRALPAPAAPAPSDEPKKKRSPLWVYVAVVGVVLAGAGLVYVLDSGEGVQRIEVTFP